MAIRYRAIVTMDYFETSPGVFEMKEVRHQQFEHMGAVRGFVPLDEVAEVHAEYQATELSKVVKAFRAIRTYRYARAKLNKLRELLSDRAGNVEA